MSDLIKRADAIKALKETYPTVWTESDYELGQKNQWNLDILAIECLPSAERKERWLFNRQYHEADECVCSGCGQLMTTIHGERMNYCPNCGASMEVTK